MMQKKTRKSSFSFGGMVTFLLLLLLTAGAVLLLIPQYRELRKKKQIETRKNHEYDAIQNQRNEQKQTNNDLRSSKDANEKIDREKFNQVGEDEIVFKYNPPEQEQNK